MENINIPIAMIAGVFSILSPCILPVLPSFLAYITGISLTEKQTKSKHLVLHTIVFAIGFCLTFLTIGAVIGSLGQFLLIHQDILQRIGGIIIILFGVHLTGLIKIKPLLKEFKINLKDTHNTGSYLRSLTIGVIFAFGWAPCYGPILGSIFTLAAASGSFNQSMLLFFFYALGFVIPLIIMAFFIGKSIKFFKKNQFIYKYSSLIAGSILIILGLLMLTNTISIIVNHLNNLYINLEIY
ncbi:hypothetical protein GF376_00575 [Candidatus Peregrinibacteria bacterium]|nr:hypothetical protein [Candidatus Peregrinibacteria bacterium]